MRVGELSRRTGVGVSTLRAWEARFQFLTPDRSPSGHRLYADADVERVKAVLRLVAEGMTLQSAIGRVATVGLGALLDGQGEALLYGQVLQAVGQGVWVMRDGRTRFVNRRMAELMGCTPDEALAVPVNDLFGVVPAGETKQRRAALRAGRPLHFTNTVGRSDGTSFLAEINMTPLFDHAGHYEGAVALVNDITARADQERQARFRAALLDAIGEAVIASDPRGNLIYLNAAAERLFRLRAADIVGKHGQSFLAEPEMAEEAGRIHQRLVDGNRHVGDLRMLRADGTDFVAHFAGAPAYDHRGELLGLIAVITDETGRARLDVQRRALEAQLETLTLLGAQVLRTRGGTEATLTEALEGARRLLGADQVALFERGEAGALRVRAAAPPIDAPVSVPPGSRSFAGYVALADAVVVVDDACRDRRFDAVPVRQGMQVVSAIGAPVVTPDGESAVLTVESASAGRFDRSSTHFVQGIANVIGAVLHAVGDATVAP
jgi:PAS domain S-box-containing protein